MIPQILSITEDDAIEAIIAQFALNNAIDPAYRIIVQPEKDELTVEQIHLLQKDIQVSFSKKVLVVLCGVDRSSAEVQNSLLKCLEEDGERIQFLLLVRSPARLLSTIVSRCAIAETKNAPVPHRTEGEDTLLSFQKNSDATKDEAIKRIDEFIQSPSLRKSDILRYLLNIRKLIIDNNMNPVLALDTILIFLSKPSTIK